MTYRLGVDIEEIDLYNTKIKDYLFLYYKTKDKKYLSLTKSIQKLIDTIEDRILER